MKRMKERTRVVTAVLWSSFSKNAVPTSDAISTSSTDDEIQVLIEPAATLPRRGTSILIVILSSLSFVRSKSPSLNRLETAKSHVIDNEADPQEVQEVQSEHPQNGTGTLSHERWKKFFADVIAAIPLGYEKSLSQRFQRILTRSNSKMASLESSLLCLPFKTLFALPVLFKATAGIIFFLFERGPVFQDTKATRQILTAQKSWTASVQTKAEVCSNAFKKEISIIAL